MATLHFANTDPRICSSGSCKSQIKILAPWAEKSLAVARPIPDEPPVMTATLPFRLEKETSSGLRFREIIFGGRDLICNIG